MIVSRKGDYSRVACEAQAISDAARVCYWTNDKQPTVTAMMEGDIVEGFTKIAALLGYKLEKIDE